MEGQYVERAHEDRRKIPTDFNRRKFDRRTKTFLYDRSIHLSDTNMFGSVYFANFFLLQGECREEFFQFLLGDEILEFMQGGYNLVTYDAHADFKDPLYNGDHVTVKLTVPKTSRMRVHLGFTIEKNADDSVVATGYQTIVFLDNSKNLIPVPDVVARNLDRLGLL